jgi:hypothetical protein
MPSSSIRCVMIYADYRNPLKQLTEIAANKVLQFSIPHSARMPAPCGIIQLFMGSEAELYAGKI